jgi:hypothetical protein
MLRRSFSSLFAICLLMLLATPARGQEWAGRGRLQGVVLDENENPIAEAKVILRPTGFLDYLKSP